MPPTTRVRCSSTHFGVRAHLAATGRGAPAVNLKLLIEGEEESGSPHFRDLVESHADRLTADAVIVSDTGMSSEDTPTVCTGMRGLAECEIELYGPRQDIHCGFSAVPCPTRPPPPARLWRPFTTSTRASPSPASTKASPNSPNADVQLLAELPFDGALRLSTAKSTATCTKSSRHAALERIWARPTAEVNGIGGGYQGPGGKTIIPSSATVKLSFRLVAGQDPDHIEKAVRAWAADRLPAGIRHEITFGAATRPCLTPLDHPALQSVVRAMSRAFGTADPFHPRG